MKPKFCHRTATFGTTTTTTKKGLGRLGRYGDEDTGWTIRISNPCRTKGFFLRCKTPRPVLAPIQPFYSMVQGLLSSGEKRPAREADSWAVCSAQFENCNPLYAFMAS